ncbi:MAG: GspH/FimT family protein [Planctomycetes bacterium]|nr:GspH/FimT family protein [Planctomycetota bacterium]
MPKHETANPSTRIHDDRVADRRGAAGATQLRAAVTMLAADLEYAKSMSISRGQKYGVVFDKTNETYRVVDESGTTVSHPVKKGFSYVVNFRSDTRLGQVDLVDAAFDGVAAVSFDYLGSPYRGSAGTIPLNSGVVTLGAAGVTRTVQVEPVTGFISISN